MVFTFIFNRATPALVAASLAAGCSDAAAPRGAESAADANTSSSAFESGTELRIPVPEGGRAYVRLEGAPAVVDVPDPKASLAWDLAFEGTDVFTNGGVSGAGKSAAFGPLDATTFAGDTAPVVPFLVQDKAGGAFLDWYAYEGTSHALFSRYHVYGVRDGGRLWKVQVLGYYGQRDGAAVSALYTLRYAELTTSGVGPTREVSGLDGTSNGTSAGDGARSECLDFATDARVMLSPAEARASAAWHLCFRRASIVVNGEMGGPRGVTAVDVQAEASATESIDAVKMRTAASERPAFDAVVASSFDGKVLRGDRIVSAFSDRWFDETRAPLAPANATWVVQNAAGTQKYLVGFTAFEAPTTRSPGTVVARIKPVKG